ncbi:hypothetical protein, partial [Bradyrhizobium sp. 146]|uniref:hypothetical protein n=1 Tax=Bradyrhizobium sp. 146 TaxID=2782622 RepID=UPI001FF744AC
FIAAPSEAGQMAAFDYVPIFFKNRLHLVGRPQMSTRPGRAEAHASSPSRRIIQRASELLVIAGRSRASMGVRLSGTNVDNRIPLASLGRI